jgi:hypothetical protein
MHFSRHVRKCTHARYVRVLHDGCSVLNRSSVPIDATHPQHLRHTQEAPGKPFILCATREPQIEGKIRACKSTAPNRPWCPPVLLGYWPETSPPLLHDSCQLPTHLSNSSLKLFEGTCLHLEREAISRCIEAPCPPQRAPATATSRMQASLRASFSKQG